MDTGYGNHLIGIYAVYSVKVDGISVIRRALLALEPLIDDTDQKAESFRDTILTYLEEYYGIIIDNIACVVADNAHINIKIARLIGRPMVGCKAHLLNLFVENEFLGGNIKPLIDKVHKLIAQCRKKNIMPIIVKYSGFKPILDNDTRWTSTNNMLKRYIYTL